MAGHNATISRPQRTLLIEDDGLSFAERVAIMRIRQRRAAALNTSQYRAFQETYWLDWSGFARDCIIWPEGDGLTDYQGEVLDDLVTYKREAVRAPRGGGKTTDAALALLAFALTRDVFHGDWKAGTTAGTWEQLTDYLWPEVHKWARRVNWAKVGRPPLRDRYELQTLGMKLETGLAFSSSPETADNIEGMHADHCLVIFDEAKIISEGLFDSIEGVFSNAGPNSEVFALAISIPGELAGRYYDIHSKKPGLENWHTRHITQAEVIAAGRMTEEWAEQRAQHWGVVSSLYQNHVLGEFSASDINGIIPLAWVESAFERYRAWERKGGVLGARTTLGVDVADEGGDVTVFAPKHGNVVAPLVRHPYGDTMETSGWVKIELDTHGGTAIIDGIGVGSGVVNRLGEQGLQIVSFIASAGTKRRDATGQMRFANKRAEAWWGMRELLDPAAGAELCLPPDDKLLGDLVTPHWRMLSNGRLVVESKDEIRKRLKRSPDDGDAVVMACNGDGGDAAEALGLLVCRTCGEYYPKDPTGKPRACPYCAGNMRRWRPAPGAPDLSADDEEDDD